MKTERQRRMGLRGLFTALIVVACAFISVRGDELQGRIEDLIRASGAERVAVALVDLETGRRLLIDADASFHAASTMKVPVMMEIYRQTRQGKLTLDEQLLIKNEFRSIADGSPYSLSPEDDSEKTLYERIGQRATVRELVHLMITESSNLATNLLIERVTPERIMELVESLGAHGMRVLRGVEDGKAYRQGLNNTTTARALMSLLQAIAEDRAVDREASEQMRQTLLAQKFNEGIPAGLPPTVRVAHKTGSISGVYHDAGIIYAPNRKPYVLVVLTRGVQDEKRAHRLVADISRAAYESLVRR
ncbi:serine hydrolase [Pyrinomonas sp.]|uniref:serine hydrolase n=1 Tax=Pyrinomonas sp. TaxID=2080306 RepID=UPI0033299BA6